MRPPAEPSALDRATVAIDARVQPLVGISGRPRVGAVLRVLSHGGVAVILALVGFGAVMVATMVSWSYAALGVLLLAAWPVLLDRVSRRVRVVQLVGVGPVAVFVPVLALLGIDVLWSWARIPRPSPALGLVIAGIVVVAVAYVYLRWVGREPPAHHERWALAAAAAALALAAITSQDIPGVKLILTAAAVGVATWIYLWRAVGRPVKHPLWWALLLAGLTIVAAPLLAETIQGGRLSLTLLIAGALVAIVAGLHGLWLPSGNERLRHARRAAGIALVFGVALPIVAFAFIRITSSAPAPPEESPLPPAGQARALPSAALDHRPILLFDSGERFRTPLDVDRMLQSGDVELCPEGKGLLADCRTVNGAGDLLNGFGNLRFDAQQLEDAKLPTTIYAHPVADKLHPGWTDIDYWWYLSDNPANTAQGAMCGAGLVIPEITCFDHQSDWEGVTVVLDERQDPVAVHYAAHAHVVRVPWATLQAALRGPALRPYAAGHDTANHPLVFVARGTHAAYPLPCRSSSCSGGTVFEDNRHDGRNAWPETACSAPGCVTAFPMAAGNAAPASWNAFDGHWGSAVCIAKVYCARSAAPRAPGRQGRYQRPWCYDFAADADLRRPRPARPVACAKQKG